VTACHGDAVRIMLRLLRLRLRRPRTITAREDFAKLFRPRVCL
jgi:hypothetical protein